MKEANAFRDSVTLGIPPRDIERSIGDIGGDDEGLRELSRERHGQAPAAGSGVGNRQAAGADRRRTRSSAASTISSVSGRGMSTA